MREVLFPRLIKLRPYDNPVHDLAEAARRDPLTLSEFACRELRNAIAPDPAGRLAPCP
jgi:translation initiation factor 2 beta subunit (eIF-2beta)/eIF-5